MLRTDHHEQDKPRREKELQEQEEASILLRGRAVMEVGVVEFPLRAPREERKEDTLVEGRRVRSVGDQMNPEKAQDSKSMKDQTCSDSC